VSELCVCIRKMRVRMGEARVCVYERGACAYERDACVYEKGVCVRVYEKNGCDKCVCACTHFRHAALSYTCLCAWESCVCVKEVCG